MAYIPFLTPGTPLRAQKLQKMLLIIRFGSVIYFVGKEGSSPLQTIKCYVFLICPTPSPSWGGISPLYPPRGPLQICKAAKNGTKIPRFGSAIFIIGKQGKSPLKSIKCSVFLICLSPSPSRGGKSPICHPRGPTQSPNATKNTNKITRFGSTICFIGKEGNGPLKPSNVKSF